MGLLAPQAWLLAGIATALGWLALVAPIFLAARRDSSGSRRTPTRLPQLSAVQKRYVDLYLLAFGGLLYWQLNRSGSFVMRAVAHRHVGNIALADPLLLIGPSLLLIAAAMVFLRAVPVSLRLVARTYQRLNGLVLPVGLSRLARDPLQATRVVLLISLTAGLVFFTRIFQGAVARSQDLLEGDALALGIGSALDLNGLALVLFSAVAFFLVQLSTAQGRESDHRVLRALGLSHRQRLALVVVEGLVVLFLGLLAGTGVGFGLSLVMIPYLSQALAQAFAQVEVTRVLVDWATIAQASAVLAGAYASTLVLLVLILGHTRAGRAPVVVED